ncbi:MAG: hypothetical protein ACETWQ_11415 [Phycisphaerae bacterium]
MPLSSVFLTPFPQSWLWASFRQPTNSNDIWYFTHDESEMEALLYDDYAPNDDYVDQRDPDNWTYAGIAFCAEVAGKLNTLPMYRL